MKTETKVTHTPGPWGLSESGYLTNEGGRPVMSSADVADEGRKRICVVDIHAKAKRGQGWQTPCAERDANALLIAAAPDLLETAEKALSVFARILCKDIDNPKWRDEDIKKLVAAIAKAKGGAL